MIHGYLLQLKPSRTSLNLEDIMIIMIFLMDAKMTGVTIINLDLLWSFQKYMIHGYLLQLKPSRIFLNLEDILIIMIFLMDVKMTGVTTTNLDLLQGFQKLMIHGYLLQLKPSRTSLNLEDIPDHPDFPDGCQDDRSYVTLCHDITSWHHDASDIHNIQGTFLIILMFLKDVKMTEVTLHHNIMTSSRQITTKYHQLQPV